MGRGMRQRRPSTNTKEHKDARSSERFVDIEVYRKKDFGFRRNLAEAMRTTERKQCTPESIAVSIIIRGIGFRSRVTLPAGVRVHRLLPRTLFLASFRVADHPGTGSVTGHKRVSQD